MIPATLSEASNHPARLRDKFRAGHINSGVLNYLCRRVIYGAITLLVVMAFTFLIFQVLGDPARRILPLSASDQQIADLQHTMGLDRPLGERFVEFMKGVLTLDFGTSYVFGTPALDQALNALPRTLLLAAAAFGLAIVSGVTLGTTAALSDGKALDQFVTALGTGMASLAEFWIGLLLIIIFSVHLGLLPTGGYGIGLHLVLPAVTLAVPSAGRISFMTRNSILENVRDPHLAYAQAIGLGRWTVIRKHIVRNASLPMLAVSGQELTRLLVGSTVVVETVFAWPGVGRLYVTAMSQYDVRLVAASVFVAVSMVLIINIALDMLYAAVDPRVRFV